jgi:hypothetical protein
MFYFCPLDNLQAPVPATLAGQLAAIADDGGRAWQGLCVDAPSPVMASATLTAYLTDCIRSGRSGYSPSVTMEEREGVPVATIIDGAPRPTPPELAAIASISDRAKRDRSTAPDSVGRTLASKPVNLPVQPDDELMA